ncbi:hypothetical protein [Allorhizobium undicola]|uniref:hypothetical protein n=1 Tax=Allorhizobium undicola TaxID=78527 RepID=UPI000683E30F|nr:hypothetical protein [Allorhizobium undicola]
MKRRFARVIPPWRLWFGGSGAWAIAMALSSFVTLAHLGRLGDGVLPGIVTLYAVGGLLGWLLAMPLIHLASLLLPRDSHFAAALLSLLLMTALATATLFVLQYRLFYAQWHGPFGTRLWLYQFTFTSASAFYQFAVLGSRYFLPCGPFMAIMASLFLARR